MFTLSIWQIAVKTPDGAPYQGQAHRAVIVERNHGSSVVTPEEHVIIPETSIVHYRFMPNDADKKIIVTVSYAVIPGKHKTFV